MSRPGTPTFRRWRILLSQFFLPRQSSRIRPCLRTVFEARGRMDRLSGPKPPEDPLMRLPLPPRPPRALSLRPGPSASFRESLQMQPVPGSFHPESPSPRDHRRQVDRANPGARMRAALLQIPDKSARAKTGKTSALRVGNRDNRSDARHREFEEALLAFSLQDSLDQLGADDPWVKAILNGKTPAQVASEVIRGTKLTDPAIRKALVEGGEAAVSTSTDPLVVLARKADRFVRELRKQYEDTVESVMTAAEEKIAKARFAIYGKSVYPDATFTLRLAYGTVQGYPMNGTKAPSKTTFYGLYDRSASFDNKSPFNLMPRFVQRKDKINLSTPLDFVATADIIGGNSGSPVINRNGEFVWIIFDGNIESLTGNFVYLEETNRAVPVHSAAIIEALRKLYDAPALANELEGK